MLEDLSISNLVLVDHVALRFSPGFNCLTGETGAGKSMLAGALGLVRGAKGDAELIRTGAEEASVSAVFLIGEAPALEAWLEEHGLALDERRLIIRRVLRRNGKNGIFIQGQAFSLKDLGECASFILDLHGQHEHQSLFEPERQRELLDRYGGLQEDARRFYATFGRHAALLRQREKLLENQQDRVRQEEYLRYAAEEISKARLQEGEDEELVRERQVLQQAGRIHEALETVHGALSAASEGGALGTVYTARHALQGIAEVDAELGSLAGRLDSLYYDLEDIHDNLQSWNDRFSFEPGRLEEIEDRLARIQHLKKKYGPSLGDVIAYGAKAAEDLGSLENSGQNLERLDAEIRASGDQVVALAQDLSARRKAAAGRLETEAGGILAHLGMRHATFRIGFRPRTNAGGTAQCGAWGMDEIEFLLGANPGEPVKPLRSVASGGELSRIMLAIKSVVSETEGVSALVFDEVDTGIGGEVALSVGEHLQKVARHTQILTITHLASIAARADNHLRVEKQVRDGRTVTCVGSVEGRDRVEEIARMLAGDREGDASLAHAREMLGRAHPAYRQP